MFRILDVASARKLIAFLTMLAPTLAVALAGDHGVSAALATDASGSQHEVHRSHAILHTFGVMLEPAGMQQKTGFRRSPDLSSTNDHACGHACDPRRVL